MNFSLNKNRKAPETDKYVRRRREQAKVLKSNSFRARKEDSFTLSHSSSTDGCSICRMIYIYITMTYPHICVGKQFELKIHNVDVESRLF